MTKEINDLDEEKAAKFISRRHADSDEFDGAEEGPRLGRRESEPHSFEISTLYDRFKTNFPEDRAFWDLLHYFSMPNKETIIQFDISYFQNLSIPEMISSYRANKYQNRIPDLAINILSKNTWRKDLVDNVLKCKQIKIPIYIVYFAYEVVVDLLPPPYLRMYHLGPNDEYKESELTEVAYLGEKLINPKAVIELGEKFAFVIGIQQLEKTYQGGKPIFHLILLHRDTLAIFPTEAELAWRKLHDTELILKQERKRADEERKRADEERKRADEERKRADELERKLKKLQKNE